MNYKQLKGQTIGAAVSGGLDSCTITRWLADKGVTDIVSGGMGERAIELFNARGVNAFVGAPKLSAQFLAEEYINGKLEGTANYCDH